MRTLFKAAAFAVSIAAATVPAYANETHYSTADTDLGTLLDNPATVAILDKYIPGMSTNEQIAMGRPMTLRAIAPMSQGAISDEVLDKIDAELAKLPAAK